MIQLLFIFQLVIATEAVHAFEIPPNDGFVTDTVGVLSESEEIALERSLSEYRRETSNEIAIVILNSLQGESELDIAVDIFREWGLGTKKNNNGLLLLYAYEDRFFSISTGYGLEGVLPDALTGRIFEHDMKEFFRNGQYFAGFVSGIESVQKHISGEYTADRYIEESSEGPILLYYILFFFSELIIRVLAGTRSWWLGGVLGLIIGVLLTAWYSSWLSIPLLILLGLLIDYAVSRHPFFRAVATSVRSPRFGKSRRRPPRFGGGSTGGGGSMHRF